MAGHRPFSDLKRHWTPERHAAAAAEKSALEAKAATLERLRIALGISQEDLAKLLDTQQPAASKLERRNDMRISTLRELIEAMGGELRITANFAGRSVELANFD